MQRGSLHKEKQPGYQRDSDNMFFCLFTYGFHINHYLCVEPSPISPCMRNTHLSCFSLTRSTRRTWCAHSYKTLSMCSAPSAARPPIWADSLPVGPPPSDTATRSRVIPFHFFHQDPKRLLTGQPWVSRLLALNNLGEGLWWKMNPFENVLHRLNCLHVRLRCVLGCVALFSALATNSRNDC